MTKIKICGIYRPEDISIVNETRPDYFGMILEFSPSHRSILAERAAYFRERIRRDIPAVGVSVDLPAEKTIRLLKDGCIDIAQLHGSETEDMIRRIQEESGKPVWKAFRIRNERDLERALKSPADMILLDNGYGTGQCFDWSLIRKTERPFALAGGLNPDNLAQAAVYGPALFDLSSGVETDRKKDPEKVKRAVEAAHGLLSL